MELWSVEGADTATTGSLVPASPSPSLRMTKPAIEFTKKNSGSFPSSANVVTGIQVEAIGKRRLFHGGVPVVVACSITCSIPAPAAREAATAAAPPASRARRETRGLICGFLKIQGS